MWCWEDMKISSTNSICTHKSWLYASASNSELNDIVLVGWLAIMEVFTPLARTRNQLLYVCLFFVFFFQRATYYMCTNTPVLIPSHKSSLRSPLHVRSVGNSNLLVISWNNILFSINCIWKQPKGLFITCYNVCLIKAVDGIWNLFWQ